MTSVGLTFVHNPDTMLSAFQSQSPIATLAMQKDRASSREKEGIHSGHFMVSRIHGDTSGDYLSDEEQELDKGIDQDSGKESGFNFKQASQNTCKEYKFGNRTTQTLAIDESLSNLFRHLTLAYSGKITSPKWKQFRGMHMNVKDKIRVNNIIWREWHLQYVFGNHPRVCQFATPLQFAHTKPEAAVVEGYYWKRRLDTIANEYKRWRKFYKHKHIREASQSMEISIDDTNQLLERVGEMKELSSFPRQQQTSRTDLLLNSNDVQEMMDLSESLFSNLKQPFDFPNPRELAGYGYGDFIQPSLLQFQPSNLDDIMDFDQLQDLWPTSKSISSDNASATDTSQGGPVLHVPHMDFEMGGSPLNLPASPGMILSPSTPPIQSPHMFDSPSATPSPGHPHSPMNIMETDFIMNHLQQLQQQTKLDQQKKEQEQKMQQNLLQQQRLAEQQKQQQQQQQELQQQKKKLEQQEQIMALLQNNDALKTLLITSGHSALLEQFTLDLQQQVQPQQQQRPQQQQQQRQQQQVQQQQQQQVVQLQPQQISVPVQQLQTTSQSSLLRHLMNKNLVNGAQVTLPQTQNTTIKPKSNIKVKTTSILEALNRDESQTKKRMMSHQTQTGKTVQGKKDLAGFIIPQGPPRRQRPLQPSPTNTASQQQSSSNSFLAQLLTTGTYPGAIVGKDDGASRILSQLQAVSQPQTIPQSQPQTINMSDFSTSILLAAVNRAIGPNQVSSSQVFQTVSKQGAVSPMAGIMVSSPVKVESLTPTPSPSASPVPSSTFNFTAMSSPSSNNSSFDDGFTLKSPEALYADLEKTELQSEAHLTAEKKRRTNIKSGFDLLHTLIPSLRQNPNAKVSKAAMLLKTAEYCKKLKAERSQMQKEADILKQEINSLNHAISVCQSQLPATGVPVTRQRADQMREMFDEYVKMRTLTNWKFWIFSLIIDKLFESFNTMVSTASMDELCRTVLAWLDQHCSLPSLRPIVSDAMRHLSTSTSILNDPSRVPEQAAQAVIKRQKHMSGDAGT